MSGDLASDENPRRPVRIGRPAAILLAVSLFVVLARGYLALVPIAVHYFSDPTRHGGFGPDLWEFTV